MNLLPALSELLDKFEYNEETGHLTTRCTGERAGWLKEKSGLRYVYAMGATYAEHRIIWFMKTGIDPKTGTIVHRNGDRADNRWSNLDLVPNPGRPTNDRTPTSHVYPDLQNSSALLPPKRTGPLLSAPSKSLGQRVGL